MKSSHAWVACSLVSAGFVFVACGSDDGKKTTAAPAGGAGGEAGEPAAVAGQSGAPPQPPEGGAGGAPVATNGGAGGASAGAGGEGGQASPPLCFDLVDVSVGGAGGAPAELPPPQPKFRFRCDDLSLGYVVDDAQNTVGFTLGLKQGRGLLPASVGRFTFDYSYYDGQQYQSSCTEESTAIEGEGGVLQLPFDTTGITDDMRFHVRTMAVSDECGNEITLDTSGENGFCWSPVITMNRGTWFIDCYEGNGSDCEATCPVP